ncbi:MAG: S-layer homology domain-containing protein [Anaerovoracaceae bacterium]
MYKPEFTIKNKYFSAAACLLCIFLLLVIPSEAFAAPSASLPESSGHTIIDNDPEGGYDGDYVLIYNDSENYSEAQSTGSISGIDTSYNLQRSSGLSEDNVLRYHPAIVEVDDDTFFPMSLADGYAIGEEKNLWVQDISNGTNKQVTFSLIKEGSHCYIWTPVPSANHEADYVVDTAMAEEIADSFDSSFPQMTSAFGSHLDVDGTGKVSLLLYDIQDGNNPNGFIGGYFSSADLIYGYPGSNYMPVLHIDTYPGIYSYSTGVANVSGCFSTLVHEYQHMLNYSNYIYKRLVLQDPDAVPMASWLNEAMSMAAEEMIYEGSSLHSRLTYYNNDAGKYITNGKSLLQFDNSLHSYSLSALFAAYLKAQTGDYAVFHKILSEYINDEGTAIETALEGTDLENLTFAEIMTAYRIALAVNDDTGIYGFKGDPVMSGIKPLVYTRNGASLNLNGGGSVLVKVSSGNFTPSEDYGSNIKFAGIKTVEDGITINVPNRSVLTGSEQTATAVAYIDAVKRTDITWESSNTSVAAISYAPASAEACTVSAIGAGTSTITASCGGYSRSFTLTVRDTVAAHEHDVSVACGSISPVSFEALDIGNIISKNYTLEDGNYYLDEDIDLTKPLTINGNVTLCLNGKVLCQTASSTTLFTPVILVDADSTFNLCDCEESTAHKYAVNSDGLWYLDELNGTETLYGGVITHKYGSSHQGNGIATYENNVTLNIYGGNIAGNYTDSSVSTQAGGSGIFFFNYPNSAPGNTLNMYGGNVCGNATDAPTSSSTGGGGVAVGSLCDFNMYGGSIAYNSSNKSKNGAVNYNGGGVWTSNGSTFNMSDGTISHNTSDLGGGILLFGTANISGGEIINNSAESQGGGIYVSTGSDTEFCTISGGIISNNTADKGGGVYVSYFANSPLKLTSTVSIKDNTDSSGNNSSNVHLYNQKKIEIAGVLSNSVPVGITMDTPGIFTQNWTSKMVSLDHTAFFVSDNLAYEVVKDGQELKLALRSGIITPPPAANDELIIEGTDLTSTVTNDWTNISAIAAERQKTLTVSAINTYITSSTVYKENIPYRNINNATITATDATTNPTELTFTLTETGQDKIVATAASGLSSVKYINIDVDIPESPYLTDISGAAISTSEAITAGQSYYAVRPSESLVQSPTTLLYSFDGSAFAELPGRTTLTPQYPNSVLQLKTVDAAGNVSPIAEYTVEEEIIIEEVPPQVNDPTPPTIEIPVPAPPSNNGGTGSGSGGKGSASKATIVEKQQGLPYYYTYREGVPVKVFVSISQLDANGNASYIAPTGQKILFENNPKYFIDTSGHWAENNIDFVAQRELFTGTEHEIFEPDSDMTRGMFATVIGRMYENSYGTIPKRASPTFSDVPEDYYYTDYISWANGMGILKGEDDGNFYPERSISREEMAAIMYRFSNILKKPVNLNSTELSYADSDQISEWFTEGCKYVQETGIMNGREDNCFEPAETALRCEVSTVLERFVNALLKN